MEALAVIAAIAILVWGGVILLRGGLLAGSLLVLLSGTCFGYPFLVMHAGPVPLTIDRILWVVLMIQYLIWRRAGWVEYKPPGRTELGLCALVAFLGLRTFTADWQASDYRPVSLLLICYVMPFGMYWVARHLPSTKRNVLTIFAFLTALGVYLAITTIAETCQVWWLVFPRYIVSTASSGNFEFVGRGRGPLLHPVGNGMLLAVCLSSALLWWPRLGRFGRLTLAALSLLLVSALYCTLTRSVWLGGMLAVAVIIGLTIPRRWRFPLLAGGLVAATLVATTQWQHILALKRDRDLTAQQAAQSVYMRPVLAMISWKMFLDRPLAGCGLFQYSKQSSYYLADRSTDLPLEKGRGHIPHNILLSIVTETGALGLVLYLAVLVLWIRSAWRLWRSAAAPLWARQQGLLFLALIGIFFSNGMFHDMTVVPLSNMLLFFTAGVTAGLRRLVRPAAAPHKSPGETSSPPSCQPRSPLPVG